MTKIFPQPAKKQENKQQLYCPPNGTICCAADSIQITHNYKRNKNTKQSISSRLSISKSVWGGGGRCNLWFFIEFSSRVEAGTKDCLYLLVLNCRSLKRDPGGNILNSACKGIMIAVCLMSKMESLVWNRPKWAN